MDTQHESPINVAQTIEAPVESDPHCPVPQFVHGSDAGLSTELTALLTDRLRAASLALFAGFGMFFVRRLFELDRLHSSLEWTLFWMHFAMTLLTGFIGIRMCMKCKLVTTRVRITEAVLFGGTAIFFALVSYSLLLRGAQDGYLAPITPMWMMLIFVYALFIPNSWRRAGIVNGLFAVMAIAIIVFVQQTSQEYQQILTDTDIRPGPIENTMLLALTSFSATWGVFAIGRLRRQAFEARQLGQYRLKQMLGSGGMGEVFLAEHMLLKRPCAVKLIRPEKAGDPKTLERFEREVQSTAKLTHWNTVEIFDYGHAGDGTFYYVMEYLPGMNLEQIVDMYGALPPQRAVYLMRQVCEAMIEAHENHLLHRDLKPANIFVAHRGGIHDVVKLLDFGLVKPMVTSSEQIDLTREGTITGSPLFLSPEQALGESVDQRSDIYSMGAVLYNLVTGRPPFDGETALKVLVAHAHEMPQLPSEIAPEVSKDLENVIMKCLNKKPSERFGDVVELEEALAACETSEPWNRKLAATWWQNHGCPDKKRLDADVMELECV